MAKIVFVSPTAWTLFCDPQRTSGGAELDLYNIAEGLAQRGHRCIFLTSAVIARQSRENPKSKIPASLASLRSGPAGGQNPNKIQISNVQIFKKIPLIGGIANTLRLWSEFSRQKPDAVFVKGAGLIVFQVGLWARLAKTKFIWRASHEQNFEPEHLKTKWWYRLYRLGLKWASGRVVQTNVQKTLLQNNFGLDGVVIYNGHLIPSVKEFIPTKNRSKIIWIGRAKPIKQPNVALDIAKRLPNIPMIMIVGEGDKEIHASIRQKTKQHPTTELHEQIPLEQTERLLSQGRVFVLTSLKEGLPNVLIQSLKWGVPVVSLHVNPDDLVREERGGVYCHGSVDIMLESIEKILEDDQYCEKLSKAGREAAEKYFDIGKVVEEYERLLKEK